MHIACRGRIRQTSVLRSPRIDVQLKATAQKIINDDHLAFPLPIRNYDDLREESLVPRILVVLRLPDDGGEWLEQSEDRLICRHCAYWKSLLGEPATTNKGSVTVHLPRTQAFTVGALCELMEKVARKELL